jgi:hypothetical protein
MIRIFIRRKNNTGALEKTRSGRNCYSNFYKKEGLSNFHKNTCGLVQKSTDL